MPTATLTPRSEAIETLENLYTKFDLGPSGYPTAVWEAHHIRDLVLNRRMRWAWDNGIYLSRLRVSRRMGAALATVLDEINARWEPAAAEAAHLDVFVRCYCFGGGELPSVNPHWWGAAYDLSPLVTGVALEEAIKIFTKYGFTWGGATNKALIRHFEFL